jgi:hypothetical protein
MNNVLALQALQAEQNGTAFASTVSNGCTSGTYVPEETPGE